MYYIYGTEYDKSWWLVSRSTITIASNNTNYNIYFITCPEPGLFPMLPLP